MQGISLKKIILNHSMYTEFIIPVIKVNERKCKGET